MTTLEKNLYYAKRHIVGTIDLIRTKFPTTKRDAPLISFCTTVMDRFDHLDATLIRNILDNIAWGPCEFVLLNYSCPDPRTGAFAQTQLKPLIAEGSVNYYYYPDATVYSMSHSRNIAFRLARGQILCNVDADNFTGAGFAAYVWRKLARGNVVLCGPNDRRGLGGRICVNRHHWLAVGGYDEGFVGWGPEDRDLINRLAMIGVQKRLIWPEKFCKTIDHSDELRFGGVVGSIDTHRTNNRRRLHANQHAGVTDPNHGVFGRGRVQKNFTEWLTL